MENASPALSADAELLLNTFQTFNAPVAFTPLWNSLKLRAGHPKEARAKELLLELVKAGLVRRAGTGKRLFYWLPTLEPQAQDRSCAALTDSPRSKAELEKNFWPSLLPNWPKTQREALLKQLVQAGRVYQWLDDQFALQTFDEYLILLKTQACELVMAKLAQKPRTRNELRKMFSKKYLPKLLFDWISENYDELVTQLLQTGRIYELPPHHNARSLRLSLQPPNPQEYLEKPINQLVNKLQRLASQFAASGIAPEQIYSLANELWQQALPATTFSAQVVGPSLSEPEPELSIKQVPTSQQNKGLAGDEQVLLEGMFQLEPAAANGALVSVTRLRQLLKEKFPDKQTFDQTALSLAEQNRVALHWHDYPSSLTQSERDDLICDERGNHYVGITLRK